MAEEQQSLDEQQAHRTFSTEAFNRTWQLIQKPDRDPGDDAEMIHMAHASRWHWGHRDDVQPVNLAVSAWQLSRVYAVTRDASQARKYGEESRVICSEYDLAPFFVAYAHEALARAAALEEDWESRDRNVEIARSAAGHVDDEGERRLLLTDLHNIPRGPADEPAEEAP